MQVARANFNQGKGNGQIFLKRNWRLKKHGKSKQRKNEKVIGMKDRE